MWNESRSRGLAPPARGYGRGMPRIPRSALPDGAFHVTARGVDGTPIVIDDLDRLFLAALVRGTAGALGWGCRAWCLMTNHFHLVVEATSARVSEGMKRINQLHAQRFNRRHGRRGHLFQDRFASQVIEDDDYLEVVCAYVLANPLRAGLTTRAEDWRWAGLGTPSFAEGGRPGRR